LPAEKDPSYNTLVDTIVTVLPDGSKNVHEILLYPHRTREQWKVRSRLNDVLGYSRYHDSEVDARASIVRWDRKHGKNNLVISGASNFEPGARVNHGTFGVGLLRRIEGRFVVVDFAIGQKKVLSSFVKGFEPE